MGEDLRSCPLRGFQTFYATSNGIPFFRLSITWDLDAEYRTDIEEELLGAQEPPRWLQNFSAGS